MYRKIFRKLLELLVEAVIDKLMDQLLDGLLQWVSYRVNDIGEKGIVFIIAIVIAANILSTDTLILLWVTFISLHVLGLL